MDTKLFLFSTLVMFVPEFAEGALGDFLQCLLNIVSQTPLTCANALVPSLFRFAFFVSILAHIKCLGKGMEASGLTDFGLTRYTTVESCNFRASF